MIKYVPTRASAGNRATFTLRDPESGSVLARLALVGRAGPPLPAGYALQFDGVDDCLFFGEQAAAFAREEGTMEMWLRVDASDVSIMSNSRNIPQGPAIANMGLRWYEHSIEVNIGNNTSHVPFGTTHPTGDGLWHHLAVGWSQPQGRILVLFDGEIVLDKREEFLIEAASKPHVSICAFNNGEAERGYLTGAMDELRVWKTLLPADSIRQRMHRRVHGLTPGLAGYWDFDIPAEVQAHNANERSQDGVLKGRPAYIRSSVPLRAAHRKVGVVKGPGASSAVLTPAGLWMQCGSDPIRASDRKSVV